MSKLYSSDEIVLVLRKMCFDIVSQRGSHGKFKNKFGKIVILVNQRYYKENEKGI